MTEILTNSKVQLFIGISLLISVLSSIKYFVTVFLAKRKSKDQKGCLMQIIPPKYQDESLTNQQGVRFSLQRFMDNLTGSLKDERISFEIYADSESVKFFVWTPNEQIQKLVKLNLYSTYKERIKIKNVDSDYLDNIERNSKMAEYKTAKHDIYMLMDVREFESMDPVQDILTSMSGLSKDEQIVFQMVLKPTKIDMEAVKLARMNFRLNKSEITWMQVFLNRIMPYLLFFVPLAPFFIMKILSGLSRSLSAPKIDTDPLMLLPDHDPRKVIVEKEDLKEFSNRISEKFKTSFTTYIRVAVAGKNIDHNLNGIEQALESMKSELQNRLIRRDTKRFSDLKSRFIYPEDKNFPFYRELFTSQCTLSSREISMLYHLPLRITTSSIETFVNPDISAKKIYRTKSESSDLVLGKNSSRDKSFDVFLSENDRKRHLVVTGQTGTGKSTLLKRFMLQDIDNRIHRGVKRGLLLMDPHEDFFLDVLQRLPEGFNNFKGLIAWDTRSDDYYIGFNPIYAVGMTEREIDLTVDSNFKLIEKVIKRSNPESGMGATGKPMLINAMKTLMVFQNEWLEKQKNNEEAKLLMSAYAPTLIEVRSLFSKERTTEQILKLIDLKKYEDLRAFWEETIKNYKSSKNWPEIKQGFENKMAQILTGVLLYTFGQSRSNINFSNLIRQSQVLLVNLSSKNIGEEGMSLLGSMLMSKVWFEAKKIDQEERRPFVVYADEFQNFATSDFSSALSEARKFKLELILAHQFFNQLPSDVFHSVMGNVKSKIYYRCGLEDSQMISDELQNKVLKQEVMEVPEYHANVKVGSDVFSLYVPKEREPNHSVDSIYEFVDDCYLKYGNSRKKIENNISKRHKWIRDGCPLKAVKQA